MDTNMKTMKGTTMLLSDELSEAVHRRIFEKNMTMREYMLDLIKQDLTTANSKKLRDDATDTDSTDDETLTEDEQRLLDILYEVACMKDKKNEE